MENCEVMTWLAHSFAYSYQLYENLFAEISKTSKRQLIKGAIKHN